MALEKCQNKIDKSSKNIKLFTIFVGFQGLPQLAMRSLCPTLSHMNLSSILGERVKLVPSVVRADGALCKFYIEKK